MLMQKYHHQARLKPYPLQKSLTVYNQYIFKPKSVNQNKLRVVSVQARQRWHHFYEIIRGPYTKLIETIFSTYEFRTKSNQNLFL